MLYFWLKIILQYYTSYTNLISTILLQQQSSSHEAYQRDRESPAANDLKLLGPNAKKVSYPQKYGKKRHHHLDKLGKRESPRQLPKVISLGDTPDSPEGELLVICSHFTLLSHSWIYSCLKREGMARGII